MSEPYVRPSMFDVNLKCDDCDNTAGIWVCTGCWEKHRAQAELSALRAENQRLREALENCLTNARDELGSATKQSDKVLGWIVKELTALFPKKGES